MAQVGRVDNKSYLDECTALKEKIEREIRVQRSMDDEIREL